MIVTYPSREQARAARHELMNDNVYLRMHEALRGACRLKPVEVYASAYQFAMDVLHYPRENVQDEIADLVDEAGDDAATVAAILAATATILMAHSNDDHALEARTKAYEITAMLKHNETFCSILRKIGEKERQMPGFDHEYYLRSQAKEIEGCFKRIAEVVARLGIDDIRRMLLEKLEVDQALELHMLLNTGLHSHPEWEQNSGDIYETLKKKKLAARVVNVNGDLVLQQTVQRQFNIAQPGDIADTVPV